MIWLAYVQMTEGGRLRYGHNGKSIGYPNVNTTLWMGTVTIRELSMCSWAVFGTVTNISHLGIGLFVRTARLWLIDTKGQLAVCST